MNPLIILRTMMNIYLRTIIGQFMTAAEGTQNSQYFFKILNICKKKINLNQKKKLKCIPEEFWSFWSYSLTPKIRFS